MSALRIVATFLLVPAFAIAGHTCNSALTAPQSVSTLRSFAAFVFTAAVIAVNRVTEWFLTVSGRDRNSVRNGL